MTVGRYRDDSVQMAPFHMLNHQITLSQLQLADHIYCYRRRSAYSYAHHGIYVGNGKVIHFLDNSENASADGEPEASSSGFPLGFSAASSSKRDEPGRCEKCVSSRKGGVQMVCIDCFLKGDTLRLFYYGVSKMQFILNVRGGCSGMNSEEPERVIQRATYLLETDGFGKYNLHNHNCEDFAIYCKTGVIDTVGGMSTQVELIRQFGRSFHGQEKKFSPVNLFKSMKNNLIDERWNRDIGRGLYMPCEQLVHMYRTSSNT